jgi:chemotaxis protein histidine kinase CheA
MDALIEEFLVETREGLNSLDYNLVMLEQNPADKERISNIFRAIHNIKSNCSYLDLERIESLAYAVEQIFYKMREEDIGLTPKILSVVFEALEKIKSLTDNLEYNIYDTDGHEEEMIDRLNKCTVMDILEIKALFVPEVETHLSLPSNEPTEETTQIIQDSIKIAQPEAKMIPISLDALGILIEQTSELVETRNQLMHIMNSYNSDGYIGAMHRLNAVTTGLQEGVLKGIPLAMAIISILQVGIQNQKFAIPQVNVLEVVRINSSHGFAIDIIDNKPILQLREKLFPLVSLSEVLDIGKYAYNDEEQARFIVLCETGNFQFGLIVQQVFDTEEIVVKPILPTLKNTAFYSGITTIGDGSTIPILNPVILALQTGEDINISKQNIEDIPIINEEKSKFIIFRAGDEAPKIAPMELISKLIEVDVNQIESSRGAPVIQYHDDLMRLVKIDPNYQIPEHGAQQLLVLSRRNKIIGLMVEEVISIAKCSINTELVSHKDGFLGSMIVNEKTYDVIDVNYYFDQTYGEEPEEISDIGRKTILLVDDSPFFRKFLPPELKAAGYNVVTCASAKEALAKLESDKFDVVVTDINMPEMDGNEFTNLCKLNPLLQNIPFLALCSDDASPVTSEFNACIQKTSHTELIEALSVLKMGAVI